MNAHPRDLVERLLEASRGYEGAELASDVGYTSLVAAALVARARNLARVIVRLADASEVSESQILLRVLLEYAVTLNWLNLEAYRNPRHWLVSDMRRRLTIENELQGLGEPPILSQSIRQRYERLIQRFENDLGGNPGRLPSVQQQATQIAFPHGYSLAYRFDSQSGVHPTALAAEAILEPDGTNVRLRPRPSSDTAPDPYAVTAVLLLLTLDAGRESVPTIALTVDFEQVRADVEHLVPETPGAAEAVPGIG